MKKLILFMGGVAAGVFVAKKIAEDYDISLSVKKKERKKKKVTKEEVYWEDEEEQEECEPEEDSLEDQL